MLKLLGSKLKELFHGGSLEQSFFDELEDLLIEGDVGVSTTHRLVKNLQEEIRKKGLHTREEALGVFKESLLALIQAGPIPFFRDQLNVFLVLGVNGVGKTTTLAKLAHYYRQAEEASGIVFAAADTFRAGAIEQIDRWAERMGVRVVKQKAGADPGAVIFDTLESARARKETLVLADTAGRMHNRANLVRELQKIDKVIKSQIQTDNYKKILILDAVTGQNGMRQAEVFHEAVGVDSVILTKWDGTAKGGIVIAVAGELGIPISFIGVGEKVTDLIPFDAGQFTENLLEGL
ncbi:MAG TPA: signal recognition particle-docking protein FtsY [Spirochaetales bacterium]|nr:signal recognition particle-docking protein FtsY [Spirochaetales bacterium]